MRRRRGRRPRTVQVAILLLPFLLVGCAVAVVASAMSSPQARRSHRRRVAVVIPRKLARPTPSASAAIDRVLAYTPFISAGVPRRKMIALTFDDGPSPYTPAIVRELLRLHAPATFFVVGEQLDYFSAGLRDELRHGFVIGDHTENHPPLSVMSSKRQYLQIETDALRIRDHGGGFPRLFRPPYGMWNPQTLAILHRLHMLMVMWSVDPADWRRPGTGVIVARVLAQARPGAIVELHDGGGDRSQTVAALPAIIAGLRRRHYDLVTVPQLLAADPPPHHQRLTHLNE